MFLKAHTGTVDYGPTYSFWCFYVFDFLWYAPASTASETVDQSHASAFEVTNFCLWLESSTVGVAVTGIIWHNASPSAVLQCRIFNLQYFIFVVSLGQQTPPSQDGSSDWCNVGFSWYYDQMRWSTRFQFFDSCHCLWVMTPNATSIFHFKLVLPFPVKIYPFEIFTWATPGSSLVS